MSTFSNPIVLSVLSSVVQKREKRNIWIEKNVMVLENYERSGTPRVVWCMIRLAARSHSVKSAAALSSKGPR